MMAVIELSLYLEKKRRKEDLWASSIKLSGLLMAHDKKTDLSQLS